MLPKEKFYILTQISRNFIFKDSVDNKSALAAEQATAIFFTNYGTPYDAIYSIPKKICTRFLLCCALLWLYIDWFSHIHQAYFAGTVAI